MESRFDAETIDVLASDSGRLEIQFSDRHGRQHTVSLPLSAGVTLGCLICDVSEKAPFAFAGHEQSDSFGASKRS